MKLASPLLLAAYALADPGRVHYAALGDSYAAGNGAGSTKLLPNFDIACGRFSGAYPVQIYSSSHLNIPGDCFKNLACGGATTVSLLHSQVPKIEDAEIVTITVGGNEVDFFMVLNSCVIQWWPSASCDRVMARAMKLVQSWKFLDNFNRLIRETKKRMDSGALLLVTGYASFFNDQTEQCNNVSFSKRDPSNVLTKELRRSFNKMVGQVNTVIKAATEAHGAIYVDVDSLFEGHRFCEVDVEEPSDSEETWFFNMHFHGKEAMNHGKKGLMEQGSLPGPIRDFFDLTKTFHPTVFGHEAIAREVVRLVDAQ
jgi:GDSL-like Lipase/Acylhydrolase family